MDNKIWESIVRRLSGEETEGEGLLLDNWLAEDAAHRERYIEIASLWGMTGQMPVAPYQGFEDVRGRILSEKEEVPLKKAGHSFWKYGLAAAIGLMVMLAALFYHRQQKAAEAAVWIVKTAQPGQTLSLVLPDSSKVWLNSGTEVSYQSGFGVLQTRLVKLKGEAYFEVVHDAEHPFVVSSASLRTTVYGTSFNIRAYENEQYNTVSVNSGKVGVSTTEARSADTEFLLPEDQLVYDKKLHGISRTRISTADVKAWVKGELIFEQTPLNEVFATLSRTYHVHIDATKANYADCKLTARFRNRTIAEILRTLKLSMNIQSKSVGQTIYIIGGNVCSTGK